MRWNSLATLTAWASILALASLQALATQPAGPSPNEGAAGRWALQELPPVIEAAKDDFTPLAAEDIERRRQRLLTAMDALEQFLAQADATRQADWKRFLEWDALRREAARRESPDMALRSALRDYDSGLLVVANPKAEQA
jgi:hypothetical protein